MSKRYDFDATLRAAIDEKKSATIAYRNSLEADYPGFMTTEKFIQSLKDDLRDLRIKFNGMPSAWIEDEDKEWVFAYTELLSEAQAI